MAFGRSSNKGIFFIEGCGCLIILMGIISFCLAVYVLTAKPQPVWGSVVELINGDSGYEIPTITKDSNEVQKEISEQVKNIGVNDVYISEENLTILLRQRLVAFKDISADIEDGEVIVYWKADPSDNPVIAKAVLVLDQNRLKIIQLGTPRFYFPKFTYLAINNIANNLLNQEGVQKELKIFNSENLKIEDVQFQKDKLYLKILVDVELF